MINGRKNIFAGHLYKSIAGAYIMGNKDIFHSVTDVQMVIYSLDLKF